MTIRPTRADEAPLLTSLALRSKAHRGYDAAFMAACLPALTITAERLATERYFVLEEDGRMVGFAGIRTEREVAELTNLFVAPEGIGRGRGRRLWLHAVAAARAAGCRRMRIEADPFAEPCYRAMGAERIGEAPSEAVPGRLIPLLGYAL
jgi:GNAT superfamily N-acetyltransferase